MKTLALTVSLSLVSSVAFAQGALLPAGALPSQTRIALEREIAQAKAERPGAFTKLASLRSKVAELDARRQRAGLRIDLRQERNDTTVERDSGPCGRGRRNRRTWIHERHVRFGNTRIDPHGR